MEAQAVLTIKEEYIMPFVGPVVEMITDLRVPQDLGPRLIKVQIVTSLVSSLNSAQSRQLLLNRHHSFVFRKAYSLTTIHRMPIRSFGILEMAIPQMLLSPSTPTQHPVPTTYF